MQVLRFVKHYVLQMYMVPAYQRGSSARCHTRQNADKAEGTQGRIHTRQKAHKEEGSKCSQGSSGIEDLQVHRRLQRECRPNDDSTSAANNGGTIQAQ